MSLPVTGVLLVLTAVVVHRQHREGRFGLEQLPRFSAAFVLAFLIGSKVLSPQYVIWLLPLVPLSAGGVWGLGVSAVFRGLLDDHRDLPVPLPGDFRRSPPGTDILLGRNLLLLVLWGLMLSLPSGSQSTEPAEGALSEIGSQA
jgi:hypothetical protein